MRDDQSEGFERLEHLFDVFPSRAAEAARDSLGVERVGGEEKGVAYGGDAFRQPRRPVEPGFFRTELLTEESTNYPKPSIEDYAQKTKETVTAWKGMSGKQTGDPAKLAGALMKLIGNGVTPFRWPAGADAVETLEKKGTELIEQANAHRELSSSLDVDVDALASST